MIIIIKATTNKYSNQILTQLSLAHRVFQFSFNSIDSHYWKIKSNISSSENKRDIQIQSKTTQGGTLSLQCSKRHFSLCTVHSFNFPDSDDVCFIIISLLIKFKLHHHPEFQGCAPNHPRSMALKPFPTNRYSCLNWVKIQLFTYQLWQSWFIHHSPLSPPID